MKNNQYIRQAQYKKGFASIILIGIIVLLVAVGGYFAWSKKSEPVTQKQAPEITQKKISPTVSKDETANWKTYTNSQYGFEFKYPSVYTIKIFDSSGFPGYLLYGEIVGLAKTDKFPSTDISISVSDNSKQLSLLDWSKANPNLSTYSSYSNGDFKNETLFGHKAISYSWQGEDGSGKTVAIENNQTIISLNTYSKTDKFLQDFNGMLSTFKFTK